MSDEAGYSLLEILVVLVILGLMASIPFFARSGNVGPSPQDVQNFFEGAVARALRDGQDQLLYLSPLAATRDGSELHWKESTGRLKINSVAVNETPVVIYSNGTSSAFVTILTPSEEIPLLTVPRW